MFWYCFVALLTQYYHIIHPSKSFIAVQLSAPTTDVLFPKCTPIKDSYCYETVCNLCTLCKHIVTIFSSHDRHWMLCKSMIPLLAYWYYFFPPWRPWNFLLSLPTYCYHIFQPWRTLNAMQIYDPTADLLILFFSCHEGHETFSCLRPPIVTIFPSHDGHWMLCKSMNPLLTS